MNNTQAGVAAGGVTFALQWARANVRWPEWANALVVLAVVGLFTLMSGAHTPIGFATFAVSTLTAAGGGGYFASVLSHLPGTSKIVPASNTKGIQPTAQGGS